MRQVLIACFLLSTPCFAYRSSFDTIPSTGIPRASVTEIEAMIVEHEKGPDELCPSAGLICPYSKKCKRMLHKPCQKRLCKKCDHLSQEGIPQRLWIASTRTSDGATVHGYYITLPSEDH